MSPLVGAKIVDEKARGLVISVVEVLGCVWSVYVKVWGFEVYASALLVCE